MSRQRVLTTALELFALRGVDGVSISEIADAGAMSKANVLHHFGTKDQLYRACLEEVGQRLEAAADAARVAAAEAAGMAGAEGGSPDSDAVAVDAVRTALEQWSAEHPDDVRLMAYGLLRLRERPGPWVLESAIGSLMGVLQGPPDRTTETILDLLGRVTYRVMSAPLRAAVESAAMTRSTTPDPLPTTNAKGAP